MRRRVLVQGVAVARAGPRSAPFVRARVPTSPTTAHIGAIGHDTAVERRE